MCVYTANTGYTEVRKYRKEERRREIRWFFAVPAVWNGDQHLLMNPKQFIANMYTSTCCFWWKHERAKDHTFQYRKTSPPCLPVPYSCISRLAEWAKNGGQNRILSWNFRIDSLSSTVYTVGNRFQLKIYIYPLSSRTRTVKRRILSQIIFFVLRNI